MPSCSGEGGWGGCPNAIFLETMDFELSFGGGFKFLALLVGSGEFFENRVRPIFEVVLPWGRFENRSKIEKVSGIGV